MNFYHIHIIGNYDDLWQVGNVIKTGFSNPFWNMSVNYSVACGGSPVAEYQLLLRELSLEFIRGSIYPNYPSRKSCIWLIRPEDNQIIFWHNELNLESSRYKIFEVKIDEESGKLYKGRNGLLPNKDDSFKAMLASADAYWKYDKNKQLFDDEYLYEGTLKIIREIP